MFSLQTDASTDAGNEESEMFLVLHFDPSSTDGKVCVRNRFFTVRYLGNATKMIGFSCDRTNANLAQGGLRGFLTHEMPWVFVFWCLAHRQYPTFLHKSEIYRDILQLSVKDALKPTFLLQLKSFFCNCTK